MTRLKARLDRRVAGMSDAAKIDLQFALWESWDLREG